MTNQKTKIWLVNGLIAALYVVLSFIGPAAGAVQFRVSESLNHLVVFNRKFLRGVLAGVIIFNLIFGEGLLDVLFGGTQTLVALAATAFLYKRVLNVKIRLILNTLFFTVSMCLIAWMLHLKFGLPFWPTYATTALSELFIMSISAPVMYLIDQRLNFKEVI